MKIEIGEYFSKSWLINVEKCTLVEMGWHFPSHVLQGRDTRQEEDCFHQLREMLGVGGNVGFLQFLTQGEVDCLGYRTSDAGPEFLSVDCAFHNANGNGNLGYGDPNENARRVAKKLVRTYFSLRLCGMNCPRFYFITISAAPRTVQAVQGLLPHVKQVIHDHLGEEPDFAFLYGEKWATRAFVPLLQNRQNIPDTAQLFVRALQIIEQMRELIPPVGGEPDGGPGPIAAAPENERPYPNQMIRDITVQVLNAMTPAQRAASIATFSQPGYFGRQFTWSLLALYAGGPHPLHYYATPVTIHGVQYWFSCELYQNQEGPFVAWVTGCGFQHLL